MTDTAIARLEQYKDKANVLFPTVDIQQISPVHQVRIETVHISPEPNDGEVYQVGRRGNEPVMALAKSGVLKLASAAGIIWNWKDTRPVSASRDYVLYQAVGAIRKADGTVVPLKATKEIDLVVIEEEIRERQEAAGQKNSWSQEFIDKRVRSELLQWRKNKLMRAETGAMLRVVRALLAIKHTYTPQELKKPFVLPTVSFAPDYSDPEVRRELMRQSTQATAALFGTEGTIGQHMDSGPQEDHDPAPPQALNAPQTPAGDNDDDMAGPWDDEEPPAPVTPSAADEPFGPDDFPEGEYVGEEDEPEEKNDLPPCHECKGEVSQAEFDYSMSRFKKPLCYSCQPHNKGKKGGGGGK